MMSQVWQQNNSSCFLVMHRWCCGELIWRAESSAASCPVLLSLHLENAGPGSSAPVEFPLSDCDPERFANRFTSVCARWLNGLWQESEAARLQANLLGEPANIQQCFFCCCLFCFFKHGRSSTSVRPPSPTSNNGSPVTAEHQAHTTGH